MRLSWLTSPCTITLPTTLHAVKFIRALTTAQYGLGGKEELIQTFAEGRGVVPKGSVLIPFTNKYDENMTLVSDENLHTIWEGRSFAVQVFRVTNDPNPNRVRLHYPADGSWEGIAEVVYTLEFQCPRSSKYDGTNGTLRGSEKNIIACYLQPSL
jgi:hypothetical protein